MPEATERPAERGHARELDEEATVERGALRRTLDAILQALAAPSLSLDAVRHAVVRYGHLARASALGPEEMIAALAPVASRAARPELPSAELQRLLHWWAIHGYHRAD